MVYEILSGFASVNFTAANCGPQQLLQNRSNALVKKSVKHIQYRTHSINEVSCLDRTVYRPNLRYFVIMMHIMK